MPEFIKRKCRNPDASLDEQDLKDIAEAEEDIFEGACLYNQRVAGQTWDPMS
jgi:hypothetical protein